ncbi:hypothetical protein SBF1_950029 [Candidatus Desulfosporosinus infrequens]|uniref:Uncharacterized protein n=1 Tax=Candidatus Desulfosporosinus infrequens TaxID=2043169 RepID=A0A2U3LXU7_9FIRM|nr:hypothetical protein SBF1_950029 [Candidatus Desulfosporosinus infrequens]
MLLGVKDEGDPQWHAGVTLFRGGLSAWFQKRLRLRVEPALGRNLVQCSLP